MVVGWGVGFSGAGCWQGFLGVAWGCSDGQKMEPFPLGVGGGAGVPAGSWKDGVSSLGVGSDRQKREAFLFQHEGVAGEGQQQWEEKLILIEPNGSSGLSVGPSVQAIRP